MWLRLLQQVDKMKVITTAMRIAIVVDNIGREDEISDSDSSDDSGGD
jgi:hypothetical protein